ncbi:hypothetical protein DVH05_003817 [Phytophthora capsici]|nr:hypothetical protein DVH05_003817 [Phytophthora capsici]
MLIQRRKSAMSACCRLPPSMVSLNTLRPSAYADAPGGELHSRVGKPLEGAEQRTDSCGEEVGAERTSLEHPHSLCDRCRDAVCRVADRETRRVVDPLAARDKLNGHSHDYAIPPAPVLFLQRLRFA